MTKMMKVLMFCLVLFLPLSGYASDDGLGRLIVGCFHPTASYESIELFSRYPQIDEKNPREEVSGRVWFRGGLTGNPYYMKFTLYARLKGQGVQMRIIPDEDTAPFPPNPACYLSDWW